MKKFFSIILCLCVLVSNLSITGFSVFTVDKDLDDFKDDIVSLISSSVSKELYSASSVSDNENNKSDSTNRLIVKSKKVIDELNSIACVSGYNDLFVLQFESYDDLIKAKEFYSALSYVEYVQEDCIYTETAIDEGEEVTIEEAAISCPSQYQSDLFGYTNAKQNMGSGSVKVAVVDSGVANDHDLLTGRVIPTGFDSVNNVSCYDDRGHGTHVAGIIAGNTNNNVKIYPYKVLNSNGNGTDMQLYLGIEAAIEDDVDIINLSLSRQGESEVIQEAVTNAYNAGITIIAAAGNNGKDISNTFYSPACCEEVISVVSIGADKYKASTSNFGASREIGAPGESILSSHLNNTYRIMSGTSMASPFISCCAAYVLSSSPSSTPDEVFEVITSKVRYCPGTSGIKYACPGDLVTSSKKCSAPEFRYESGDFAGRLDVVITCSTPNATIMYNTSDMPTSAYYEYTGPVTITETTTFIAFAVCKNYITSINSSANYIKSDFDASSFVLENDVLVGYNGIQTDVVVPSLLNGGSAIEIDSSAFAGNESIESVTFNGATLKIRDNAFEGCTALKSVTAPAVTTIGDEAFKGCTSLTSFSFVSVSEIGESSFEGCSSLCNISLPALITVGDYAFKNCTSLGAVELKNVTSIGTGAFENSGITQIITVNTQTIGDRAFYNSTLPKFNFNYVTEIGESSFAYCDNLTLFGLPKLTTMGSSAFEGCSNLTDGDVSYLTSIPDNAFKNCSLLSNLSSGTITSIGDYAFYGCESIATTDVSSATEIGEYAFAYSGLSSVTCNANAVIGAMAFGNCDNLTRVISNASHFDTSYFKGSDNIEKLVLNYVQTFEFNGGSLNDCFPKLNSFSNTNGIRILPDGFFKGCSNLTELKLNGIDSVGAYAFSGTPLVSLSLDSADELGVGCFSNMINLETISLASLTTIDFSVFDGSENIKSVNLSRLTDFPDGFRCVEVFPNIETINTKSVVNVPDYAFKDCVNLTTYTFYDTQYLGKEAFANTNLTNPKASSVWEVGERAFADCPNLGYVNLSEVDRIDLGVFEGSEQGVTDLNYNYVQTIPEEDIDKLNFADFPNLKSVAIADVSVLPDGLFKNCTSLETVVLSYCTTVGSEAFKGCLSLKTIKLPKATEIGSGAFDGCSSLEYFTADSVTSFDFDILNGCSNLETLSFNKITEFPVDENGSFTIEGINNLVSFTANAVKSVPSNFFKNFRKLTTVSMSNATSIGDYAFYNTNITSLTLGTVKSIGDYAFYNSSISSLSKFNSCNDFGDYCFAYCDSLTSVNLTQFINSIGKGAFGNCDNLTSVEIQYATSLPADLLQGSLSVTSIKVNELLNLEVTRGGVSLVSDKPELTTFYADAISEIPNGYFANNPKLSDISIVNVLEIGDRVFMNTSLAKINCNYVESVGEYAFYGTKITSFSSEAVTSIGDYAFAENDALKTVTISTETPVTLGKYCFENDTALTKCYINGDLHIPEGCFKNCTSFNYLYSAESTKNPKKATISRVDKEAFYNCNILMFTSINFDTIEYMGTDCFYGNLFDSGVNTKNIYNMPNLIVAEEGAFNGFDGVEGMYFENAEIIRDIPNCNYVLIGSDIEEFSTDYTTAVIYAYDGSIVNTFCNNNGISFKRYNETDTILTDVEDEFIGYDINISFDVVGFNTTYQWYGCNKEDRSDTEIIPDCNTSKIDPIAPFFDGYEENKYLYYYCVATSTENGNKLNIESGLSKNLFASIVGTENTFIDYYEGYIFTDSLENINTLDNILVLNGEISNTPSYSYSETNCYGTGTEIYILNSNNEPVLPLTLVVYGDLNGDSVVDVLDAAKVANASGGLIALSGLPKSAADTNNDSIIDVEDYQAVVNKAVS